MLIQRLSPLLLLIPMVFANAGENALSRAEHSCLKSPTPETRAICESQKKETMAAFEKEEKAKQRAAGADGQKKKNDLCFTRKATGEVVCPN
jgi:hypothetical protein